MYRRTAPADLAEASVSDGADSLDAFRHGQDTIRELVVAEVGDVTGRSVLHLRCRSGLDTLSWARRGARHVVGLDALEPAVEAARELAADLGLGPERAAFVRAGVYEAAEAAPDDAYDIVHTGAGTLSRLPDLQRWAETAASLVAPGGFLHLAEFHPLIDLFGDEVSARIVRDYLSQNTWAEESTELDAGFDDSAIHHPVGEVVTAVAAAGLRIDFLREHEVARFQRFGSLEPSSPEAGAAERGASESGASEPRSADSPESGVRRPWLPTQRRAAPLMYSLRATRDRR
ncbi:class I SAM-dependent methyltransferase [Streptomyces sp. TP-A0874]|uniref:class I SAM-dependent methyltransferase n=1 Tax=Streptomyces sp. TP-A0874 TaxID=549819 RepID=UPI000852A059|nr:class I SAM-dependent methyltransferase [Streptomyces sp. TP-A0874]